MKLPGENSIWLSLTAALVVGVVVLVGFGIGGLSDLPPRPGPPRDAPPVQTVGTTPQERAAALTASATADATQVARYNADVTAWATERANRRTASFALLAGAVALLTAAVGAAAHAETVRKNRSDARAAAASRGDERFATAIEHLSSDQLGVRVGAIYSLEALGREDDARVTTVVQVLLAFTKPWWDDAKSWSGFSPGPDRKPAPDDTRLAFAAAVRTRTQSALPEFSLSKADLAAAQLREVDLRGAYLVQARVVQADLTGADLADAELFQADFLAADLSESGLAGARFSQAKLRAAKLHGAILDGTDFRGADLRDVDFRKARLRNTNLRGALLIDANLTEVDLSDAKYWAADLVGAKGVGTHPSHLVHLVPSAFDGHQVLVNQGEDAGFIGTVVGVRQQAENPGVVEIQVQGEDGSKTQWVPTPWIRLDAHPHE